MTILATCPQCGKCYGIRCDAFHNMTDLPVRSTKRLSLLGFFAAKGT